MTLRLAGVDRDGATRARLVLAATYPWFAWNGIFPSPTQLDPRCRVNGAPGTIRYFLAAASGSFLAGLSRLHRIYSDVIEA